MESLSKYEIPWWSTSFDNGEEHAVSMAVKNKKISQGAITEEFEKKVSEYLEVPHVVAVTSGSSALLLSLLAIGVKAGDEVIVPNRTWIATAHAVSLLGATPVFVDTESDMQIMNLEELESKITQKTKAIIPVYMNGHEIDIKKLKLILDGKNIKIIEDAAQALGSKDKIGKYLGTQGDIGCFSLSVAKIISTGQGGFVVTKNEEIAFKLRNMRTHGVENTISVDSWKMLGFNFRFTDILASIGIVQMGLLEKRISRLKEIQRQYSEGLQNVPGVKMINNTENEIGPYIEILTPSRKELMDKLRRKQIESRAFYPDLNTSPYWRFSGDFKNSIRFSNEGLYLPSGPSLTDIQIKIVLEQFSNV
jgi:dTDP-4-amino-4,6-dideoxygalactose transaminase